MPKMAQLRQQGSVTPREGRVSRNHLIFRGFRVALVTPREGRVSRNSAVNNSSR